MCLQERKGRVVFSHTVFEASSLWAVQLFGPIDRFVRFAPQKNSQKDLEKVLFGRIGEFVRFAPHKSREIVGGKIRKPSYTPKPAKNDRFQRKHWGGKTEELRYKPKAEVVFKISSLSRET